MIACIRRSLYKKDDKVPQGKEISAIGSLFFALYNDNLLLGIEQDKIKGIKTTMYFKRVDYLFTPSCKGMEILEVYTYEKRSNYPRKRQ